MNSSGNSCASIPPTLPSATNKLGLLRVIDNTVLSRKQRGYVEQQALYTTLLSLTPTDCFRGASFVVLRVVSFKLTQTACCASTIYFLIHYKFVESIHALSLGIL